MPQKIFFKSLGKRRHIKKLFFGFTKKILFDQLQRFHIDAKGLANGLENERKFGVHVFDDANAVADLFGAGLGGHYDLYEDFFL